MSTATLHRLTVSAIAELLVQNGYRVTVTIDDAVVGERPVLGVRHALRRIVGQRNADGSFRVAFLFARPGKPGGPVYEHDLVDRVDGCRDLAHLIEWFALQNVRPYPAKVGT